MWTCTSGVVPSKGVKYEILHHILLLSRQLQQEYKKQMDKGGSSLVIPARWSFHFKEDDFWQDSVRGIYAVLQRESLKLHSCQAKTFLDLLLEIRLKLNISNSLPQQRFGTKNIKEEMFSVKRELWCFWLKSKSNSPPSHSRISESFPANICLQFPLCLFSHQLSRDFLFCLKELRNSKQLWYLRWFCLNQTQILSWHRETGLD